MDEEQGGRLRLQNFIKEESTVLHKILRQYVLRAGLVGKGDINTVAHELLNNVIVEAFVHADRLKPNMQPRPWLLGIAMNLIKRQQTSRTKREQREPLIRDLYARSEEVLDDDELFDLIATASDKGIVEWEANDTFTTLLSGLSKSDADLLRLEIIYDLSSSSLADALGITTNAARVRLHRALDRLREIHRVGGTHE